MQSNDPHRTERPWRSRWAVYIGAAVAVYALAYGPLVAFDAVYNTGIVNNRRYAAILFRPHLLLAYLFEPYYTYLAWCRRAGGSRPHDYQTFRRLIREDLF